jgi:hypothetical protein
MGATTATLVVNDGYEDSAADSTTVTVQDTLGPQMVCPGAIAIECQRFLKAYVTLAPATATDACEGPVAVTNDRTRNGADASGWYPMGSTVVTFTATDSLGHVSTCRTTVTVEDTAPPVVSVLAVPSLLWPPTGWMHKVFTFVIANDACDPFPHFGIPGWLPFSDGSASGDAGYDVGGAVPLELADPTGGDAADPPSGGGEDGASCWWLTPHIFLESVTMNEPNLTNDIQGASIGSPDFSMSLRAQRDPNGTGRIYTITYRGTDDAGNPGYGSAKVKVPIHLRDHGHDDHDYVERPRTSPDGDYVRPPGDAGTP